MIARSTNVIFLVYLLLTMLLGSQPLKQTEESPPVYPDRLSSQAEDKILQVTAQAVRLEDGATYRLEVTITNKTNTMVDILANCGSLVTIEHEEFAREDRDCAAVHSMGLPKNASEKESYDLPAEYVKNESLKIKVRYEDEGVRGTLELDLTPEK